MNSDWAWPSESPHDTTRQGPRRTVAGEYLACPAGGVELTHAPRPPQCALPLAAGSCRT